MDEIERTWKVGELARATGLTIRALHHYDDIGLLVPGRTESRHRVYARADVERLYRVLALRGVGLALEEIGSVLDDAGVSLKDTVRRHVATVERDIEHRRRLLVRLRSMLDALESASAPTAEELIGAVEAMSVVDATITDIVTRERWAAVWELHAPYVVLLRESEGQRIVPIWIGESEAAALDMSRRGVTPQRPMAHDLMMALLEGAGARVERVVIERLHDNTFFATVTLLSGAEPREVDARPSDALNLALRAGAPIRIATDLVATAGVTGWPGGAAGEAVVDGLGPPDWIAVGEARGARSVPTHTVGDASPRLVRRAAERARELGNDFVGPGHLLLAILEDEDEDQSAARLLARHGLTPVAVREAIPPGAAGVTPGQRLALTPPAMFAMHRASVEARRRDTRQIGPLHLVLALIDSSDATLGLDAVDIAGVRDHARAAIDSPG